MSEETAEGLETPQEEPAEGLPAPAPEPQQPSVDVGDFEARLRGDPEFALSEFKKHQARADRAVNELKQKQEKFKDLEQWVDTLGGAQAVLHHLGRLGALSGNPQMRAMIEEFERTGRVTAAGATDSQTDATPEYLDPVEKELHEVKQELAKLKAGLGDSQAAVAKDRTRKVIAEVLEEHSWMTDEQKMSALRALEQNIQQWDQTEGGRQLIGNLSKEQLRKFVRATVLDDDEQLYAVAERLVRDRAAKKGAASTVVATPVQSNGREVSGQAKTALEVVREAMRQHKVSSFRDLI